MKRADPAFCCKGVTVPNSPCVDLPPGPLRFCSASGAAPRREDLALLGPFAEASGVSALKNTRPTMEDTFDLQFHLERAITDAAKEIPVTHAWGVFDGHGGSKTSRRLAAELFQVVTRSPNFLEPGTLRIAVAEGFAAMDAATVKQPPRLEDGSTCCSLFLRNRILLVANVGDSRAVLCRSGKAMPLSVDHKPNRPEERKRITGKGGFVRTIGVPRVNGVLAVSRAFGDGSLRPFVIAEPQLEEVPLTPSDEFVIIASDGLWDVVSNQEACDMVKKAAKAGGSQAAAKMLTKQAIGRGSLDNVTVIVINLQYAMQI